MNDYKEDEVMYTGFDTVIFVVITAGPKVVLTPVAVLLRTVYIPIRTLVFLLMAILLLFSIMWLICFGVIMPCGAMARFFGVLRPILFLIVLPFEIIGAVLIAIAPLSSPSSIIDWREKLHILLSCLDFN